LLNNSIEVQVSDLWVKLSSYFVVNHQHAESTECCTQSGILI